MNASTIVTTLLLAGLSLLLVACDEPAPAENSATSAAVDTPAGNDRSHMAHFVVEGNFEDVRDNVKFAITGRGIKINNVSHIGNMLKRTAEAVGASKTVYANAEAIEFCSSTVSRATMEADPHNIVFCPYIIAVYAIEGEPGKVHVAYRHPLIVGSEESKKALQAVEDLIGGIVKEAIE